MVITETENGCARSQMISEEECYQAIKRLPPELARRCQIMTSRAGMFGFWVKLHPERHCVFTCEEAKNRGDFTYG